MSRRAVFLILVVTLGLSGCGKRQTVIFDAESIEYRNQYSYLTSTMEEECAAHNEELSRYMDSGWQVVAASPKTIIVADNKGTCVGTEYVLQKSEVHRASILLVAGIILVAGILVYAFRNIKEWPTVLAYMRSKAVEARRFLGAQYRTLSGKTKIRARELLLVAWTVLVAVACLSWGSTVLTLRRQLSEFWYPDRDGYVEFVNGVILAERILGVMLAILCLSAVASFLLIRKRRKDSEYV